MQLAAQADPPGASHANGADLWEAVTRPSTLSRELWEWTGSGFRESSWAALLDSSRRAAAALRLRGVERGETVAAVLTSSHAAIAGLVGAWFAGARVASLPVIARGMSVQRYTAQLRRLVAELDASVLLVEGRFLELLPAEEGLGAELVSYESLLDSSAGRADPEPLERDEIVFVQYSSGTTGEPRGAMLTAGAIGEQLVRLVEAMEIEPEHDVGLTWLPLSHDMGLFGCVLCAWAGGIPLLYGPPERFITGPHTWLEDCAAVGATLTAAPPFALGLAARSARRVAGPLSVRTWLIGADQIAWSGLTSAVDSLAPLGVTLESITPAYGLSEATLAVTVGDLRAAPSAVDVDGRTLVSSGRPIRDVEVRTDTGGVGEICVRTPSLASGYHNRPADTRRTFRDGVLRTGDIGLIVDGELYVVGRPDDVIVVGGRNVHAAELERSLAAHPGVRPGNCALVDPRDGSGSVALVAEVDDGVADTRALAQALRRTALELAGIRVRECVFLPRGRFPKTPSGKVQRFACHALLADDAAGVRVRGSS